MAGPFALSPPPRLGGRDGAYFKGARVNYFNSYSVQPPSILNSAPVTKALSRLAR